MCASGSVFIIWPFEEFARNLIILLRRENHLLDTLYLEGCGSDMSRGHVIAYEVHDDLMP